MGKRGVRAAPWGGGFSGATRPAPRGRLEPEIREGVASPSARGQAGHEALSRAFYEIGISYDFTVLFPIISVSRKTSW